MPDFHFQMGDGKKIVRTIEAKDRDAALGIALTALSTYSGSKFPPPEHIEITVSDANRRRIATLRFIYEIDLAPEELGEVIAFTKTDDDRG